MNKEQDIDSTKSAACEEAKTSDTLAQPSGNNSACCQPSELFHIPECCKRFEAMDKDDPVTKEQFETYLNRLMDFVDYSYVRKDRNPT